MTKKSTYDADSISVLEGLEAVRKRPGMYIGSVSRKGLNHLIYEIVDNSVDEHLAGFCSQICVFLERDGSCTVSDNGRASRRSAWSLRPCTLGANSTTPYTRPAAASTAWVPLW